MRTTLSQKTDKTKEKRILLVDDERPMRELLKLLLNGVDRYCVLEAGSGEEALEVIKKEALDLVITDFRMAHNGMTGGDLALAIKEFAPKLPIILVTGFHDPLPPGVFDAVLHKPFSVEQLRAKIQKLLGTTNE